jgi:uroporphyrinogen decarboxylase
MNGFERISAVMNGEKPDTVPIMLHNFMMAASEYGASMAEFRSDPKVAAGAFIASVEKYGFDGVLVDFDTATLAEAIGVPTDHPENEPARCKAGLLTDLKQVERLKPVDLANNPRVNIWLETVRLVKSYFGNEIFVRGNCDQCPFSLASLVRSISLWMMDLLDEVERESVYRLLDYCADVTIQFINLMAETGADMLSNGDSTAGPELISPDDYRRFALPWEKRVVGAAHRVSLPFILHICGNTLPILKDMLESGADGVELDFKTDPVKARDIIKKNAVFFGNIDPSGVLALGSVENVQLTTSRLLEVFSGNDRFVLNAGCAIPSGTPSENIITMINTARSFGIR